LNLILFDEKEIGHALELDDVRAVHILKVLKRREGEEFDAGIINGPKGKGRLLKIEEHIMRLDFDLDEQPADLYPLTLIIGLTRPQIARRILREATILGICGIEFIATDRGEKSYPRSRLWTNREYEGYLIEGAQQAFTTRLPTVRLFGSLKESLSTHQESLSTHEDRIACDRIACDRIALDNYEASTPLREIAPIALTCLLAVGSERGWSKDERLLLKEHEFTLAGLGNRVLSTETACVSGISLILAKQGYM